MINNELVSEKIYNILKGHGLQVSSYDDQGKVVIDPLEATRFAVTNPNILVRFDREEGLINLSANKNSQIDRVREDLQKLAQEFLLSFDFKIFGKRLTPKSDQIDIQRKTKAAMEEDIKQMQKLAGIDENIADTGMSITSYYAGEVDPDFANSPDWPIVIQSPKPASKRYRFKDKEDLNNFLRGKADKVLSGNTDWIVVRNDTAMDEDRTDDAFNYKTTEGQQSKHRYAATISDDEYQQLRKASMRGMFPHKFKKIDDEVVFSTREPNKLAQDLEKIVDSGETSWTEILGIHEAEDSVMEGFGYMTGSSKTSYQPLDNIKIVVKHRKPVNEESRGSRSRNIHSIYIQRGAEKFKMAENNLSAARAMARHVHQGGEVFDSVGESITEMAREQRKLKEFVRYVRKANLINEENADYVTLAQESISNIKSTLHKLSGVKTYATAVESINDYDVEVLEDDVDLESKFTEKHFDNRVAEAGDFIRKALVRQRNYTTMIEKAIQAETFDNVRDLLSETDEVVDFATPHARLGYQVARLGDAAQNNTLKNQLYGISRTLESGAGLNDFEYRTVKSCLMQANQTAPLEQTKNVTESIGRNYEKFLSQFEIF